MPNHLALLESEPARIKKEQTTALRILTEVGAKQKLTQIRDEVWGVGQIQVIVGTIDLRPKFWDLENKERKVAPELWETVYSDSYAKTIRKKIDALAKGSNPETLAFGVDPDRYKGWAGISLVFYYPDIGGSGIPSGMYGVDYSRVGPDWFIDQEDLTVASYEDSAASGPLIEIFSKKFNSSFVVSDKTEPEREVANLLHIESAHRIAGAEDVEHDDLVLPASRALINAGWRLSPMVLGFGIQTNAFAPDQLLYAGFIDRQFRRVSSLCNDPYFTETMDYSRISEEIYAKRVAGIRPGPELRYSEDRPVRWLLDTKLLSIEG